ncbi:Hypothetical protein I5071_4730 [Sandaracinus amylolyticus]|nr:Hypothetical protein I5071_4730 [Sandaracinus amylolyticus]
MRRLLLALALSSIGAITTSACATRQLARTVGRGRTEVGVLVGGPLQSNLGFAAPVPEHRVHGRYGLTDELDLSASVPLTPIVSSILALDVGFVAQIVRFPRFAMSASLRLHCVYDLDDGWNDTYYPELGVHMEQRVERRLAIIAGTSALVQASPPDQRPGVFLAPYLGLEVLLGEHALSLALGWINPWMDGSSIVTWEPAGFGAMTVTFGWRIQPGGVR